MKSPITRQIEGLLKEGTLTQADIARKFNISGARVYQIKCALTKPSRAERRAQLNVAEIVKVSYAHA